MNQPINLEPNPLDDQWHFDRLAKAGNEDLIPRNDHGQFIAKAYIRPTFDGESFDKDKDQARLTSNIVKVRQFMSDGEWHTAHDIRRGIGASPDTAILERVRDLRKERFGAFSIESKRREGGTWCYRMVTK